MTRALNNTPLALHATSAPAWQLWAQVAQLSHHLQLGDWLLVGGQMVALHCHLAGINPGRATIDIDVVANVVVTSDATSTTTATHASVVSTAGWTGLPTTQLPRSNTPSGTQRPGDFRQSRISARTTSDYLELGHVGSLPQLSTTMSSRR